jgi:monoterpene epsilon-lactone hydrolase
MASWQAHWYSFLLRHLFKPRLASATDVHGVRKVMTGPRVAVRTGAKIAPAEVGGVQGEWITCEGAGDRPTLLYVHGGGFIACAPQTHRSLTVAFARAGYDTFAPDYRLAPEHPFPAGLDDVVAAYRALSRRVDARRVVIAGDSAGAALAVSLLVRSRDEGLPLPAAAVLFSPFADLSVTGDSVHSNASRCAMFTPEGFTRARAYYIGDRDPREPLVSPIYADLHGLPPLLIHVGQNETLLDDSRRLAERARQAGVDVTLKVWPAVPHVWQLFHRWIPEGRTSIEEACRFFADHLGAYRNSSSPRRV